MIDLSHDQFKFAAMVFVMVAAQLGAWTARRLTGPDQSA
jgi:hypothetical protein